MYLGQGNSALSSTGEGRERERRKERKGRRGDGKMGGRGQREEEKERRRGGKERGDGGGRSCRYTKELLIFESPNEGKVWQGMEWWDPKHSSSCPLEDNMRCLWELSRSLHMPCWGDRHAGHQSRVMFRLVRAVRARACAHFGRAVCTASLCQTIPRLW